MTKSRDRKLASLDRRHFEKLNMEDKKKRKKESDLLAFAIKIANLNIKGRG